jgi:hypothetical protein
MDAEEFYKMPVNLYQIAWHHIPGNNNLNVNTDCEIATAPSTYTSSLMIGLLGDTWICLRNLDKGDKRESGCKLWSREHETLRFNLYGRKSILRER